MIRPRLLLASALLAVLGLAGCKDETAAPQTTAAAAVESFQWKMVTAWPKNYPGLGTAAERLAERVKTMSNGRLTIKVYAGGELVPPLEVFDAVSRGTAEMGHGAAYYWKGKVPAAQFFTAVPFGLSTSEMNAWLSKGGGQALWEEAYAPFGVKPLAVGNTGMQMGGWYNKEINSLDDLKGLKIRMPGLGGEVLSRLGATTVNLPGGEVFTALQTKRHRCHRLGQPLQRPDVLACTKAAKFLLLPRLAGATGGAGTADQSAGPRQPARRPASHPHGSRARCQSGHDGTITSTTTPCRWMSLKQQGTPAQALPRRGTRRPAA